MPEQTALTVAALPSLYEVEESLAFLLDTAEQITPEQEQEFRRDLAQGLTAAVAKRDRFAAFIKMAEYAAQIRRAEAARHAAEARVLENAAERARAYGVHVIEGLGRDAKGKYRKLEGSKFTLAVRAVAASLELTDRDAVPLDYKSFGLTIQASAWPMILERIKDLLPAGLDVTPAYRIDEAAVKKALLEGLEVPGADLITGKNTLVVK